MEREVPIDGIINALGEIILSGDANAAKEILRGFKHSHPEIIQKILGLTIQKAFGMNMFFHSKSKVTVIDPAHHPNYSILICPELKSLHSDLDKITFRWAFTEMENGNHYLPDDTIIAYGHSDYVILFADIITTECDSHTVKKMTEMARQISPRTVVIAMTFLNRGYTAEDLGVDEFYSLLEL